MNIHLVVVRPFDGLSRGDIITEPSRIETILAGERAHFVVKVAVAAPGGN